MQTHKPELLRRQTNSSQSSRSSMLAEEEQKSAFHNFTQQILKAWLPIPSLTRTIILFFIMSAIFLSIGIPMIVLSNNIVDVTVDYDEQCFSSPCNIPFTISQKMVGPVFVYYQLHNFFQNHRLYSKSVNYNQLGGETISLSDAESQCSPIVTNADVYKTTAIDGTTTLDPLAPANPCGMIAYSVFNDTYTIAYPNGTNLSTMTTEEIAWPSDIHRYSMPDPSVMWQNITDPRFQNWMRIATLPTFRKLWARINHDLQAGDYTLTVNNNYAVDQFNANKYFILSTSNFFGSRNQFLSIIYLVIGGVCFIIGVGFSIRKCKKGTAKVEHRD